ncbi:hypothetical protein H5U35_07860, partial [Candidatus Aerophobetes bacterium]|nr:hypothetical protein [Candidatus Aerophobetes bacterium]
MRKIMLRRGGKTGAKSRYCRYVLLFLAAGLLVISGEVKSSEESKKPTIDLSRIRIEDISCKWGEVSLDITSLNVEVLTNEENLYLFPLKIFCDIYLNDVKLVGGLGEDLKITKVEGGSVLSFTARIENQNIIKWWVSHIKNKE